MTKQVIYKATRELRDELLNAFKAFKAEPNNETLKASLSTIKTKLEEVIAAIVE